MIILRQTSYSSRDQKAMRDAFDIVRGGEGQNARPPKELIEKLKNRKSNRDRAEHETWLLMKGRRLNKRSANIGSTVDSSINSKAVGMFGRRNTPTASGLRLISNEGDIKPWSKKILKKYYLNDYDHGTSSSPSWNKKVMELTKYNKEKK